MTTRNRLIDIGVKAMLTTAVVLLFVLHFQKDKELAFVDAHRVAAEYRGTATASRELERITGDWKSKVDTLRSELEALISMYEKDRSTMGQKARQEKEDLIRSKQTEYVEYKQMVDARIAEEDRKISSKVLDVINSQLRKYGEERGYKIILAATQYGNIAYAEDGLDITEDVINLLNNE